MISTDMEQEGNKVMGDIASKMQAVVNSIRFRTVTR